MLCFGLMPGLLKISNLKVRESKLLLFSEPFSRKVASLENCIVVCSLYWAQKWLQKTATHYELETDFTFQVSLLFCLNASYKRKKHRKQWVQKNLSEELRSSCFCCSSSWCLVNYVSVLWRQQNPQSLIKREKCCFAGTKEAIFLK